MQDSRHGVANGGSRHIPRHRISLHSSRGEQTMTQREKLQARLAEVEKRIAEYPCWGAALTALDEERRELKRAIKLEAQQELADQAQELKMGYE